MAKEGPLSEQHPKRERLEPGGVSSFERQLLMKPPERPNISAVPRSGVLGRLQDFLPKMQAANHQLEQQLQAGEVTLGDLDIENVEEGGDAPVIEMDLACGLFDIKDGSALAAAERALEAGPLADPGGEDSDSSDDSSSSAGDGDGDDDAAGAGGAGASSSGRGGGGGGDAVMGDAEERSFKGAGGVQLGDGVGCSGGSGEEQGREGAGGASGPGRAKRKQKRKPLIEEV
ncbi:hypothetical protein MNEG_5573 [Monoraphidium neglectum]|uniref:Uncharacterized protein n=1 Tax=Monoraphidium neglectum TaxID=145388 RepID=A0A0D2L5U6_9CHLO|nr:hypothetical protein MNEG_5573 [Monoraphidium neglectum]KIZ02389.1 hypothetical protein MNEG_5573 [Monoraphidium neglectum]|eukprot:XP_013901408.1 hypothetical protein MNEG_5573 [Monoraphidium neglectum]